MHTHNHHHQSDRRLLIALLLTFFWMICEGLGAWFAGSLALWADAGHMLMDNLALAVAFGAVRLSRRPPDIYRTYGYRRFEILGALFNGLLLLYVAFSIIFEAKERFFQSHSHVINAKMMFSMGCIGLLVNLINLWLLRQDRKSMNVHAAFLHVLGDALGSVAVIVASVLVMLEVAANRVDIIASLCIAVMIVITSVQLLREVVNILLESAPAHVDPALLREKLKSIENVQDVHDLHIWSITNHVIALSAHVVTAGSTETILNKMQTLLRNDYNITHTTIQIENKLTEQCGCEFY